LPGAVSGSPVAINRSGTRIAGAISVNDELHAVVWIIH
jgi:hypothetical protein